MDKPQYAKELAQYAHDRNLFGIPIAYCPISIEAVLVLMKTDMTYPVLAVSNILETRDNLKNINRVLLKSIQETEDMFAMLEFRDYCKAIGWHRAEYSIVSVSYEESKKELEKLKKEEWK